MPLFGDQEGHVYYGPGYATPLLPVIRVSITTNIPWRAGPQDGRMLRLPPGAARWLRRWCKLAACFNAGMVVLTVIAWRVEYDFAFFPIILAVVVTGLVQHLLLPLRGEKVVFDQPVRLLGAQPWELQMMELAAVLTFVILALLILMHPQSNFATAGMGCIILFHALRWLWRRSTSRIMPGQGGPPIYP